MEFGDSVFIRDPPMWTEVGRVGLGRGDDIMMSSKPGPSSPSPQAALECSRLHRVVPCWANRVGSLYSYLDWSLDMGFPTKQVFLGKVRQSL